METHSSIPWAEDLWAIVHRVVQSRTRLKTQHTCTHMIQQSHSWAYIQRKETCIPMFTGPLFTIAKAWKQPKCSTTEEWIKKTWYIYTIEYYSVIE